MIDAVTLGEAMAMARTLLPGKPANHSACHLAFGGSEANVAIALSRLGHRARWISALGSDAFGDLIILGLQAQGVEVSVNRSETKPTGFMFKTPSTSTERFVVYYRSGSAASAMQADDFDLSLLSDARLLHITGIFPSLSSSTRELVYKVVEHASRSGLTISFDVNYRSKLWPVVEAGAVLKELARRSDIVFGDRDELAMLVENPSPDNSQLLAQVSNLGPNQVVLKLGEAGALALVNGSYFSQQAVKVDVVDTVGAGDAFVAGYLSAWLDGARIEEGLIRAVICGAQACTDAGDWEGSPTREQVELIRGGLIR